MARMFAGGKVRGEIGFNELGTDNYTGLISDDTLLKAVDHYFTFVTR
jgi:hypothetical protein